MIIGAGIRPADDLDDKIAILPYSAVGYRRSKKVAVIVDPLHQVEWRADRHDGLPWRQKAKIIPIPLETREVFPPFERGLPEAAWRDIING
jgi:hypothetical protein